MTQDLDRTVGDAIAQQAAEWWLAHREASMKDFARQAFLEWLRRSPEHVAAYLSVAASAQDLIEAARSCRRDTAELISEAVQRSDAPIPVVPLDHKRNDTWKSGTRRRLNGARRSRIWRMSVAMTAAAILATVSVSVVLRDGERFGIARTYETAHAEQGSWRLPDGSVLHLNSDSRAMVHYGQQERLVTVDRGQAMFQVAKDPKRRFHVDAGAMQIVAIGTEFDVYRGASRTRVVVLEGRVAVVRADHLLQRDRAPTLAAATHLAAGQQAEVGSGPERIVARPANVRLARAWLQREIVFDQLPLERVVEDFNRYSRVPIEVKGENLKGLQISGVFGAYDLESFITFLRRLDGVRVEETPTRILIYPVQSRSEDEVASVQNQAQQTARPASAPTMN